MLFRRPGKIPPPRGRRLRHGIATLSLAAAGLTCSIGPARAGVSAAESRKPNVVLIMADDFGYECVTANGGESYQTPNLDRLAAGGMRFTNCYVQPRCTPTRVQLMTGLYNVRNYIRFGLLDPEAVTFGHLLKKAGYATGIAGKWQLGQGKDLPRHFGFDEAYLWQHTRLRPRYANPGLEKDGVEEDYTNGEYGPTLVNDFVLDFCARHKDEPFFFVLPDDIDAQPVPADTRQP
jgi:arylsulfatase A